jgi:hypothetical protein
VRALSWRAVSLAGLVVAGCGQSAGPPLPTAPPGAGQSAPIVGARVAIVVMENEGPAAVLGNTWLGRAARSGGQAVNAYGDTHPSLGNYLAMLSGSTQGVADDDVSDGPYFAPTVAGQLTQAGISWKAYMDGMPAPCYQPTSATDQTGRYAKRHNPFFFFSDVIGNLANCRAHVVPGTQLAIDVAAGLPRFVWITPDVCEDMHDCSVATGERWMARTLPAVIRALGPHGVLFVTTDEGDGDAHGGGRVPLVALGAGVRPGSIMRTPIGHRALAATVEDVLGLKRLDATRTSPTLRALLR